MNISSNAMDDEKAAAILCCAFCFLRDHSVRLSIKESAARRVAATAHMEYRAATDVLEPLKLYENAGASLRSAMFHATKARDITYTAHLALEAAIAVVDDLRKSEGKVKEG